tara:strand:+ start:928 stop:1551 length:624 start_codon:yes stop_codon:yes gene_type:complete
MNRDKGRSQRSVILGSGWYDRAVNTLLPNAKFKLRDNEYHSILYTKDGFQPASFMGPNTDLMGKIKDGVVPVTDSDRVAMAHDLRYSLSSDKSGVRAADIKMVAKLKEIAKNKSDYRVNIYTGQIPIQAKMKLEDLGVVGDQTFASYGGLKDDEIPIAKAKLKELELQGYGKKKKTAWMKHVAKCKKQHPNMPYKDILKIASKSYKK